MEEFRKVNSMQLYWLWRNLAIALLCMAAVMACSSMLPFYMAPVESLLLCAVLYTMIWNSRTTEKGSNIVVLQTMLFALLGYTFVSVLLVFCFVFDLFTIPSELIFFNEPFIPSLLLLPIAFLSTVYALFFKDILTVKPDRSGLYAGLGERGYFSVISSRETRLQLKNMAWLFAALSALVWWYYLKIYVNIDINGRDWYMFVWMVILTVIIDEVYFVARYYNLYLDLQEHNEIITPEELRDVTAKTYLRFYVICGEYIYFDRNSFDRLHQKQGVYDTPFVTNRTVNGVPTSEARTIVERMTGYNGGELRFFFGRHLAGVDKHSLLRYFYFLDGTPDQYADMGRDGEWIHFDEIKKVYSENPGGMAANAVHDISRLATIILTERVFDEEGNRKNRIRSYKQHLSLGDVRKCKIDLQDDKWIHVANFNSDARFFRFKKFLLGLLGGLPGKTADRHG